ASSSAQCLNCSRSPAGAPSSPAVTTMGSGYARSSISSIEPPPRAWTRSRRPRTMSSMMGFCAWIIRAVKACAISDRTRVWSGGSRYSNHSRSEASMRSNRPRDSGGSFSNSLWKYWFPSRLSLRAREMSAWRMSIHTSARSCQWTGSSARSRANRGYGLGGAWESISALIWAASIDVPRLPPRLLFLEWARNPNVHSSASNNGGGPDGVGGERGAGAAAQSQVPRRPSARDRRHGRGLPGPGHPGGEPAPGPEDHPAGVRHLLRLQRLQERVPGDDRLPPPQRGGGVRVRHRRRHAGRLLHHGVRGGEEPARGRQGRGPGDDLRLRGADRPRA